VTGDFGLPVFMIRWNSFFSVNHPRKSCVPCQYPERHDFAGASTWLQRRAECRKDAVAMTVSQDNGIDDLKPFFASLSGIELSFRIVNDPFCPPSRISTPPAP
jgi:hypothetical protein